MGRRRPARQAALLSLDSWRPHSQIGNPSVTSRSVDAFQALADPVRRDLLTQLVDGPARVVDLTSGQQISRPAVSRHLRVLSEAGLVRAEDRGRNVTTASTGDRLLRCTSCSARSRAEAGGDHSPRGRWTPWRPRSAGSSAISAPAAAARPLHPPLERTSHERQTHGSARDPRRPRRHDPPPAPSELRSVTFGLRSPRPTDWPGGSGRGPATPPRDRSGSG